MKHKIRFIVNPISGVGRKNNIPYLVDQYLDHEKFEYDIIYTEYRKHAKRIAYNSSLEGFDVVCAVGGDGSVHEVGTALIGTKTKLAILPAGSGNGLARHLKIPMDLIKAIECINRYESICMDTVFANDKPFLGTGGYGFDALIAKRFDEYHARGFWSYIKLVIKEFKKFESIEISFEIDGIRRTEQVMLCSLANSSEFGNGFCISPKSNIEDGNIELCILKPFRIWHAPKLAFQFFTKKAGRSRFMEIISVQNVKFFLKDNIAHYDGEPFEVRNEINIKVYPKSLNIIKGN